MLPLLDVLPGSIGFVEAHLGCLVLPDITKLYGCARHGFAEPLPVTVKAHHGVMRKPQTASFGDSIKVSTQEGETPTINGSIDDHLPDIGEVELPAGILHTVCDHQYEYLLRPPVLGEAPDLLLKVIDTPADGVQQRSGGSRDIGLGVEVWGILQWKEVVNQFEGVLIIELHQGKSGLSSRIPLVVQERVEPSNYVVSDGLHRTAAVKNHRDMGLLAHGVTSFRLARKPDLRCSHMHIRCPDSTHL